MFVRTKWSKDEIIRAVHEFVEEFSRPPHVNDWSPDRCKWQENHGPAVVLERTRIRSLRDWPSATAVKKHFGSWNIAIAEAGYEPHKRGGGRKWKHIS